MKTLVTIKKRSDFRNVYDHGRRVDGSLARLFVLDVSKSNRPRYGITVTRRIRTACDRNLLKRRCREIVRSTRISQNYAGEFVINLHEQSLKARFEDLEKELSALLEKAGVRDDTQNV